MTEARLQLYQQVAAEARGAAIVESRHQLQVSMCVSHRHPRAAAVYALSRHFDCPHNRKGGVFLTLHLLAPLPPLASPQFSPTPYSTPPTAAPLRSASLLASDSHNGWTIAPHRTAPHRSIEDPSCCAVHSPHQGSPRPHLSPADIICPQTLLYTVEWKQACKSHSLAHRSTSLRPSSLRLETM